MDFTWNIYSFIYKYNTRTLQYDRTVYMLMPKLTLRCVFHVHYCSDAGLWVSWL